MAKVFYFDVETTGLDCKVHDIIQLAYIIEIDNEIKVERSLSVRPVNPGAADPQALAVNGITIAEAMEFPAPIAVHAILLTDLGKYVDKYDTQDKFYPCAYNGNFDMGFLAEFFKRIPDPYFGSWFNGRLLDPLPLFRLLDYGGLLDTPDHKLETMSRHFGAGSERYHDALCDVQALRRLMTYVMALVYCGHRGMLDRKAHVFTNNRTIETQA